jgi:hypothetical protein
MPTLRACLAACLLAAGPALADDPGEIPLELEVGKATVVSRGPVRNLICDDGALVEATEVEGFPALRGRAAGKTICSLTDASSMRRVYRVTVVASAPGGPGGPGGR